MTKIKADKPKELKCLGFEFYFDSMAHQYKAKLHAKSVEKFKMTMKQLAYRGWEVSNSCKVRKFNELIRGWISY